MNQSQGDVGFSFTNFYSEQKRASDALQGTINFVFSLVEVVFAACSVTVEVLLRYGFGERYLTLPLVVLGAVPIFLAYMYLDWKPAAIHGAVYVAAVAIQLTISRFGFSDKRPLHSRSPGFPIPPMALIFMKQHHVFRWGEPCVVFVLSTLLWFADVWYGAFLAMVGVSIFMRNWRMLARSREQMLDARDRQIESEFLARALDGEMDAHKCGGFVLPGASSWSPKEQSTLVDAYSALEPRLRNLITTRPATPGQAASDTAEADTTDRPS